MSAVRLGPWLAPASRLRARYAHATSLAWRARLSWVAPELAAAVVPGAPAGGWRTESVAVSDTGLAVALVEQAGAAYRVAIKVPSTVEGVDRLRRQAQTLAALHGEPGLAGWLRVAPRPLGRGEVDGRPYWVETAPPGTPVTAGTLARRGCPGVLGAAGRLIGELHARTGRRAVLDEDAVRAWVDEPLRRIEGGLARAGTRDRYAPAIASLRAELLGSLTGRTARTGWIHGDFWPGNLLASAGAVTGVVDWDLAAPGQLPLHDLLHVHLFARRLATGAELGDLVVSALRRGVAETTAVPAGEVDRWLDGIPPRPAVLLYWLRHVCMFIDSEGHGDNPRWLRGNVERVLANA